MNADTARKTFRYYWRHVRRFPRFLIPSVTILPINTLVNNYLPPLVVAVILNKLSTHAYTPHHIWADFGGSLLLFLFLSLIGGTVLWRLFDMVYWRLEGNVDRSIYQEIFNSLIDQTADFHANQFAGSLVSAANKLGGAYVRLADTLMFLVSPLIVGLIFVTIVMSFRAPLYSVLLLSFSVVYIITSFIVSSRVRQRGTEVATAESKQTGILADALTNVMAIKSFARGQQERERFAAATDNTFRKLMGMMYAFQRQHLYLSSVTGILSGLALAVAVVSVVSFGANLATAFLIFSYTNSIANQLFQFSNNALRNINRSIGDANDMIDILALTPEIIDPEDPEEQRMDKGAIEFRDVVFTHNGADDALFNGLNISIKAGEKIGLVGHSGSGKTTFTRLLLRFSDIDGGEIAIDGQDITHVTQNDLHSTIAYVPQEPLLFHRSIRENIAYGKPDATEAEIEQAARQANAHDFIAGLQDGYETLVGERGVKLSGGQRQRIAIARAILKDAPILVLDEATSSLDSESEALIQDALWKLMEGRTAIVVAHRLSTIQHMDRIVVLSDGEIVEQGSHKQLLKLKSGTYTKLWKHQSGGFIEE